MMKNKITWKIKKQMKIIYLIIIDMIPLRIRFDWCEGRMDYCSYVIKTGRWYFGSCLNPIFLQSRSCSSGNFVSHCADSLVLHYNNQPVAPPCWKKKINLEYCRHPQSPISAVNVSTLAMPRTHWPASPSTKLHTGFINLYCLALHNSYYGQMMGRRDAWLTFGAALWSLSLSPSVAALPSTHIHSGNSKVGI